MDVAGLFPGANTIAAPLGTALALLQLLNQPGLTSDTPDHEPIDLREPGQPARKAA